MYTRSEKIEMQRFMRPFAPSVQFARSLRMELSEAKGSAASEESKQSEEPSLLTGIDLDTLPEAVRKSLEAKELEFKSNLSEKKKATELADANAKKAEHFQSLSDKRYRTLQKHNLTDDQQQQQQSQVSEEDTLVIELAKELEGTGLKPEIALAHAKIQAKAGMRIIEKATKSIIERVQPMAQEVHKMKAEQAFDTAQLPTNDPNEILQIPEVKAEVQKQLNDLSSQGIAVDVQLVNRMKSMVYGDYVQNNPEAIRRNEPMTTQTQRINTGGGGGMGFRGGIPPKTTGGEPIARDADTQKAWDATKAVLLKGTSGEVKRK